jgi:hypothetical protein
MERTYTQ